MASPGTTDPAQDSVAALLKEPHWPPLVSLFAFMVLNLALRLWLPSEELVGGPWVLTSVELILLTVLLVANPSRHHRRSLRRLVLTLVNVMLLASVWATAVLIYRLITGAKVTEDPGPLLAAGTLVWLGNTLAFALMYWLMDGGGPIPRERLSVPVDFAFTQHLSPEVAPVAWRPVFLDYLHLGFTNSTAFSPTDVMPLTLRAKYAMLLQSTISLALFGLIVARAVNAFT